LNEAMTDPFNEHLDPHEIAAYVDGGVGEREGASIQAHLAQCTECRAEVTEVMQVVHGAPRSGGVSRRVWIPAAAAAVLALLWVAPRTARQEGSPQHRQEPGTALAPRPIVPIGTVDAASELTWSSVSDASGYRVRLFDPDGTVIWEHETPDTVVALPSTVLLTRQTAYYWRVEAQTGFDRRVESELVEFRLRGPPGR
jgi:hypothetical protein